MNFCFEFFEELLMISYIKHTKECFVRYPNTSKLVKDLAAPRFFNPLLSVWISDETLFLGFDITTSKDSLLIFKTELKSINCPHYLNCMVICFTLIDPAHF